MAKELTTNTNDKPQQLELTEEQMEMISGGKTEADFGSQYRTNRRSSPTPSPL